VLLVWQGPAGTNGTNGAIGATGLTGATGATGPAASTLNPTFTGTLTCPTINASTALQVGGANITYAVSSLLLLLIRFTATQTARDNKRYYMLYRKVV
jgi:hypothetical protein